MAQMNAPSVLSLLTTAARERQARHGASWSIGIVALGVANLFACAYLERYIGTGNDAEGFMLLFAVESFFLLLTGAAVINRELAVIAERTRVMPLTSGQRYDFVLLSLFRHRAMVMISATALFAVAVLGHGTPTTVAGRCVLTALLIALIASLMSTIMVLHARPGATARSIIAVTGIAIFVLLTITAVIAPGPVLNVIYPLRWTTNGTVALSHGSLLPALPEAAYLALTATACIIVGRRHA